MPIRVPSGHVLAHLLPTCGQNRIKLQRAWKTHNVRNACMSCRPRRLTSSAISALDLELCFFCIRPRKKGARDVEDGVEVLLRYDGVESGKIQEAVGGQVMVEVGGDLLAEGGVGSGRVEEGRDV